MESQDVRPFVLEGHEPEYANMPHTGWADAYWFVLQPVLSWEYRLKYTLQACDRVHTRHFMTPLGSLPFQILYAIQHSPNGRFSPSPRSTRGITINEYGFANWLDGVGLCDEVLNWLRRFFDARLRNRAEAAFDSGDSSGVVQLCDELARRFTPGKHGREAFDEREIVLSADEATSLAAEVKQRSSLSWEEQAAWIVSLSPSARLIVGSVWRLGAKAHLQDASPASRPEGYPRGFNGYEEEALGLFLETIDDVRALAFAQIEGGAVPTHRPRALDGSARGRVISGAVSVLAYVETHGELPVEFGGASGMEAWIGTELGLSGATVRRAFQDAATAIIRPGEGRRGRTGASVNLRLWRMLDYAAEHDEDVRHRLANLRNVVLGLCPRPAGT